MAVGYCMRHDVSAQLAVWFPCRRIERIRGILTYSVDDRTHVQLQIDNKMKPACETISLTVFLCISLLLRCCCVRAMKTYCDTDRNGHSHPDAGKYRITGNNWPVNPLHPSVRLFSPIAFSLCPHVGGITQKVM